MTVTVAQALTGAALDAVDARVLLRHALGVEAAWLVAHDRDALTPAQLERYAALVARRRAGEPVAYLTGEREFFGLSLSITPAVLIPRPETELLVEWALETISTEARAHFLDLGTGSGCIATRLPRRRPRWCGGTPDPRRRGGPEPAWRPGPCHATRRLIQTATRPPCPTPPPPKFRR